MPSKFEIHKQISRGRRQGDAEIVVLFNGKSVTRHTRNGVGRHPDDTIPALHRRLEERLAENKRRRDDAVTAQGVLAEKKPKDYLEHIVALQVQVAKLEADRPLIEAALLAVRKEDPLMVNYF